ncbi:hypothetical protein PVAP13_5NG287834 [Panicum virgatum]|uniref:Uncharacterized protein n=1 Tax=Panicum virgatum TaxID=38727 RepID=A0A8T0RW31_PANVG|nr:hypothetical protein PVAP13_5NG287834 [Panicum virgatum]
MGGGRRSVAAEREERWVLWWPEREGRRAVRPGGRSGRGRHAPPWPEQQGRKAAWPSGRRGRGGGRLGPVAGAGGEAGATAAVAAGEESGAAAEARRGGSEQAGHQVERIKMAGARGAGGGATPARRGQGCDRGWRRCSSLGGRRGSTALLGEWQGRRSSQIRTKE